MAEDIENREEATEEENAKGETASEQTQTEEEITDKHGQQGISKGKYEREIKQRDERIAELESKIAEASKNAESAKELQDDINKLREEMKQKDIDHALSARGCKSIKAATALLADYDGDIDKLADDCPFLFESKQSGSTGAKPSGSTNGLDAIDKAMGINRKE